MGAKTDETMKAEHKKAKYITIAAALITAATPGVYSALEAAKAAVAVRQETKVRDRQETDLQKNLRALEAKVDALAKSAATHHDLLDLVIRLRPSESAPTRPRRPRASQEQTEREKALEAQLRALKAKAKAGEKAVAKATAVSKAAPTMKPAAQVRKQVQAQEQRHTF